DYWPGLHSARRQETAGARGRFGPGWYVRALPEPALRRQFSHPAGFGVDRELGIVFDRWARVLFRGVLGDDRCRGTVSGKQVWRAVSRLLQQGASSRSGIRRI